VTNTASVSGGGEPAANNGNNTGNDTTAITSASTTMISGTLYEDTDRQNDLDVTEPKMPAGITVKLLDSNNNVVSTTTSDSSGNYIFTDVSDGNYKIQVDTSDTDIPTAYTLGTPNNLAVTISGSSLTNQNFGFDQPVTSKPNVLLVKRITAINGSSFTEIINGVKDTNSPNYVPEPHDIDDNNANWPSHYLQGLINGGTVRPDDEVEYTIYFLSTGDVTAPNVLICDRIPDNTTFIPTAFNSSPAQATGGLPSADRGIVLSHDGTTVSLTGIQDSDTGQYFPPGVDPKTLYPKIECGGANTNGAVVVNLGDLPKATTPGTPSSSFGYIRFRLRVK
jgi:uncharacterized repeat protein (TIGR01451 family)